MGQFIAFTTSYTDASEPLSIQLGFTPARIEVINLSAMGSPTNTEGWKAYWQTGMPAASAIVTKYNATPSDISSYITSNGITLLNQLGEEQGQYGAVVSGFTNANPGVITVDSTSRANITAGSTIRVALVADDQSGDNSLNGDFTVASVTETTITLVEDTSVTGYSVYVSGGVVSVLVTSQASTPNPPFNIYSNVPTVFNEAIQGFILGTSSLAGAGDGDTLLVSAWDNMVQF